jgi:hypothetical protein
MRLPRWLPLTLSAALVTAACSSGTAPVTAGPEASAAPSIAAVATSLASMVAPTPTAAFSTEVPPSATPPPTATPVPTIAPTDPPLGLKTACQILTKKIAVAIAGKGEVTRSSGWAEPLSPDLSWSNCQREVKTAPLSGVTTNIRVWGAQTSKGFVNVRATFDYWSKGGEWLADLAQETWWVPSTITPRLGNCWILVDGGSYAIEVSSGGLTKAESIRAAKEIAASL